MRKEKKAVYRKVAFSMERRIERGIRGNEK